MLAYIKRLAAALAGTAKEKGDVSHLSESVFLDAYVAFEWFISDTFLAYMNNDFTPYQDDLAQRISMSIKEKFGAWAESRTKYSKVTHLPVDQIEDIVDPASEIVTFPSTAKMIDAARKWIAPRCNGGILGLNNPDRALIDTAKSIRNYIAHGSERSYMEMNDLLSRVENEAPNRGLGRGDHKIANVGSFLKAQIGAERRVERYLKRLKE